MQTAERAISIFAYIRARYQLAVLALSGVILRLVPFSKVAVTKYR